MVENDLSPQRSSGQNRFTRHRQESPNTQTDWLIDWLPGYLAENQSLDPSWQLCINRRCEEDRDPHRRLFSFITADLNWNIIKLPGRVLTSGWRYRLLWRFIEWSDQKHCVLLIKWLLHKEQQWVQWNSTNSSVFKVNKVFSVSDRSWCVW